MRPQLAQSLGRGVLKKVCASPPTRPLQPLPQPRHSHSESLVLGFLRAVAPEALPLWRGMSMAWSRWRVCACGERNSPDQFPVVI